MRLDEAAAMLGSDFYSTDKMVWADFGCGNGTFTLALATMLSPGSFVYAIDSNATFLKQIPLSYNQVSIEKHKADFIHDKLPFEKVDGILMANSLHYVQHKDAFLKKSTTFLKKDGRFLVVEYNTDQPVPVWVPFPVSFIALQGLFKNLGYNAVRLLGERPSVYKHAHLYSALITR